MFSCLAFISCGQETNESAKIEPPKEEWEIRSEKRKQLDTLNKTEATNLSLKYNSISGDDSSLKFTYQLQGIVKENSKTISFIGYINDICQKDDDFILKISGTFAERRSFGEVLVSPDIFRKINDQLDANYFLNKWCFIFKPTSIKSGSLLTIKAELYKNDDAETVEDVNASAELAYDFSKVSFFFKGSLVDFYMYKKLPKDNN